MDINVFVIALVFSLILSVLGFMGKKSGWGLLILFGGISAVITTLVLYSDGSLTGTECVSNVCAAANGNFVSDFNAISVISILVAGGELIVAIRRIVKI